VILIGNSGFLETARRRASRLHRRPHLTLTYLTATRRTTYNARHTGGEIKRRNQSNCLSKQAVLYPPGATPATAAPFLFSARTAPRRPRTPLWIFSND